MGILFLNVLVGGVIGGIILVWRLLVAAVYLVKAVVAVVRWTIRKLAGEPIRT